MKLFLADDGNFGFEQLKMLTDPVDCKESSVSLAIFTRSILFNQIGLLNKIT
ncbi:hypothetical protein QSE00_22715 [Arenibacter sp. M-2]|uniref:hypothetical protein n=1 Tax=Arenibacter sp. M-2 TaxID=3053612 RepID=UPI002570A024|nr:hypothetical protein [Arenibacter sp. M-2]MDL5514642.1 hypothetical protein [Arenibacter sp. M-2]